VRDTILGSLGGALGVARQIGGSTGTALAHEARSAFVSGMDLGMATAAGVAGCGVLLALLLFPVTRRRRRSR
jgi:hypothetical protein